MSNKRRYLMSFLIVLPYLLFSPVTASEAGRILIPFENKHVKILLDKNKNFVVSGFYYMSSPDRNMIMAIWECCRVNNKMWYNERKIKNISGPNFSTQNKTKKMLISFSSDFFSGIKEIRLFNDKPCANIKYKFKFHKKANYKIVLLFDFSNFIDQIAIPLDKYGKTELVSSPFSAFDTKYYKAAGYYWLLGYTGKCYTFYNGVDRTGFTVTLNSNYDSVQVFRENGKNQFRISSALKEKDLPLEHVIEVTIEPFNKIAKQTKNVKGEN